MRPTLVGERARRACNHVLGVTVSGPVRACADSEVAMTRRSGHVRPSVFLGILCSLSLASAPSAQTVLSQRKFTSPSSFQFFGTSVASLGDLDGDGNTDLAVGATFVAKVYIVFLGAGGTVKSMQPIDLNTGEGDFGNAVASLGDLDGDGITDLAVGEDLDGEPISLGVVWILFLRSNGTVKHARKIGASDGGFGGVIDGDDDFGSALASPGDLDGDGNPELAVGADGEGEGNGSRGAMWILFLDADGTVKHEQKITENVGGFGGDLAPADRFGTSVAALGDFGHDGIGELAVGARGDRDGGTAHGAVWILFLRPDGTVKSWTKISATAGGFEGHLDRQDDFGISVAAPGDMDGDGIGDLAVGAQFDDDGGTNRGAVWILLMNADPTVKSEHKISETAGGFSGDLDLNDFFGRAVTSLGDLDGNGTPDIAVGAAGDDDRGDQAGAVWLLNLEGPPCFTLDFETEDDLATPLGNGQVISTPPEFGDLVRISGAGANAGPAIFDSTPGGPNDPALNDDMLIGQGNVLLLEDDWYAFAQSVPGFFDVVTDDPQGGDLVFDFVTPVDPRSILLADINPPPNQGASVTLFDEEDRTRTYFVEPGWTGPYGDAGPHELDLVTQAPQPGNGTPRLATASQTDGFEQDRVVKLVVHLTGYGAVDELSFCVPALAQASATTRNGLGGNPTILTSGSMPVLGETWNATLDCSGTGSGVAVVELRELAASGKLTPSGEVLVGGALLYRTSQAYAGSPSSLAWPIPHDMSLLGLEVHVQGMCLGQAASLRKTRGTRLLSNAIDLVLGF